MPTKSSASRSSSAVVSPLRSAPVQVSSRWSMSLVIGSSFVVTPNDRPRTVRYLSLRRSADWGRGTKATPSFAVGQLGEGSGGPVASADLGVGEVEELGVL